MDVAENGDPVSQEQIVLQWLQTRGYGEAARRYEEEKQTVLEGTADGQAGGSHGILFRSLQNKDPSVYIKSYSDLQSWISQALEAYKHEILGVSFPVFVHCYLKAVERGQPEQAAEFLKTWRQEHEEFYPQEMQALGMVTSPEQIQAQDFTRRAREERLVVRLSNISYGLLEGFLSDNHLLTIMQILNEHMRIIIDDRPPSETFRPVTFESDENPSGGPGGRAAAPIRWKTRTRKQDPTSEAAPLDSDTLNTHLAQRLALKEPTFLEPPPLPGSAVAVASGTSPTILMATVTNSYQGLTAVRFTSNATQLAAGFQDRSIQVYRLLRPRSMPGAEVFSASGGPVAGHEGAGHGPKGDVGPMVLRGHSQPVYGLGWHPSMQHLLSCAGDGTVRLWDVAVGRNMAVYKSPAAFPLWDVAFAPLGHYFAAGCMDRMARIWSTNRTQPVRLLVGHFSDVSCVAWHPNCNYVLTGSWDKTARLWDVQTGRCVRIYSGHLGPLTAVAVHPEGRYVAAAGGAGTGGSTDDSGVVRIWEITTGKLLACLEGHKGPVHRVCFTADGSVLATGGADHTVRTWEVRGVGGAMASNTPLSVAPATFRTKGTPVLDVAFTSRNLLLAAGPS